ncbi:GMC family oxidoreductase [Candidatus Parcubacteria bacterium]|nr:GMC family oxidoreductase [Candidatus Parcubacteria bacterium]
MFINSDSLKKDSESESDICIIGTGAAGISMALKFSDSPLKIIMLESGKAVRDSDIQKLNDLETSDLPIEQTSRIRTFGGTTTAWSGRWKPHDRIDLEKRDWIEHSGWPVGIDDLDKYYEESARVIGTPSLRDINSYDKFPFRNNDLAPTSIKQLKKTHLDFGKRYTDLLAKSQNIVVYTEATVTNLNSDAKRVTRAEIKTLGGNSFTIKAKTFVLACGGIENARLLLLSKIGNEYDQVGRYYMDHPKGIAGSVSLKDPKVDFPWMTGIGLSEDVQRENQTLNSYVLLFPTYERDERLRRLPKPLGRVLSKIFKLFLGKPKKVSGAVVRNYMEQSPDPENRVTLGNSVDAFGNKLPLIRWSLSEIDKKTMIVLHKLLGKNLLDTGLGSLQSPLLDGIPQDWPISEDASHHMGTTRMGTDPRSSVVNPDCRVHSVENLYIAGSSVFPTSGACSPTTTIIALTLRLADHIKGQLYSEAFITSLAPRERMNSQRPPTLRLYARYLHKFFSKVLAFWPVARPNRI